MKTAPSLIVAFVVTLFALGCDKKPDAAPPVTNDLRSPAPIARGGIPDDSIKPVAPVARIGTNDDSVKPIAPVARGGIPDDSVKPVKPVLQPPVKPLPAAPR